jgi:hypothetical protein
MSRIEMRFDTPERLQAALAANPTAVENGDAYEITDPSGIKLRLAKAPTSAVLRTPELQAAGDVPSLLRNSAASTA